MSYDHITRGYLFNIWNEHISNQDFSWDNVKQVVAGFAIHVGLSSSGFPSIIFVKNGQHEFYRKTYGQLVLYSCISEELKNATLHVLECTSLESLQLFAVMCSSFIREYRNLQDSNALLEKLHKECYLWKKVFADESDQVYLGVLGELYMYSQLRFRNCNSPIWQYPTKSIKDFQINPSTHLEVKTTGKRQGYLVHIHGVWQLEVTRGNKLDLAFVRLEKVAEGGHISIQSLLDSLSNDLSEKQKISLEKIPLESRSMQYNVLECKIFHIDKHFPRIINSTLAPIPGKDRIDSIQYGIELSDYPSIGLDEYLDMVETLCV